MATIFGKRHRSYWLKYDDMYCEDHGDRRVFFYKRRRLALLRPSYWCYVHKHHWKTIWGMFKWSFVYRGPCAALWFARLLLIGWADTTDEGYVISLLPPDEMLEGGNSR